ncbi:DinB family protein [Streptomyces sp. NPDC058045]|uniref:mycothiol transferase n=1 Tax=Streptomyces sp. NPDC058045 TaxID=3346311 RepID=UPI0036ED6947
MDVKALLNDAYSRIQESVHTAVEGLAPEQLNRQPEAGTNSVTWLVWHLTRVQDDHISELAGRPQAWAEDGWAARFGLPHAEDATGYGHTAREVAQVTVDDGALLLDYYDAVHARTLAYLDGLTEDELDRVVDEGWTPPVTLGVRLVSVLGDDLQHAGQAEFLRGMLARGA